MIISTSKIPAIRAEDFCNFQHDIKAVRLFDFSNSRTWEATENKGSQRPLLTYGTWEGAENKTVVGNVRNYEFRGDKLSQRRENFKPIFRQG